MLYDSQEISKVSPNLSLRLSPERKCSPCRYPCICVTCHCTPCRCCKICHYLPCRCFLHYSPIRCCSPCHTIRPCSPCHIPVRRPCSPIKTTSSLMGSTNATYNSPKKRINYNEYEERQFNDFLRKLMMAESQIEDAKVSLALNPDFNCEDAFRIFELNGRGFIDENDLKCGLNLIGIYPTNQEIRLLMKRFDLQKTGKLSYADFFDMLVPFEKEYRTLVENRLPNSCCPCRCPDIFCYNTLCSLKTVFNLILNCENDINNNRRLFGTLRLKLNEIFRLLDYPARGYFTNNDLIVYLQNKGIFSSNKDADLLFIRLDKERNGNVYYREVEDELQTLY